MTLPMSLKQQEYRIAEILRKLSLYEVLHDREEETIQKQKIACQKIVAKTLLNNPDFFPSLNKDRAYLADSLLEVVSLEVEKGQAERAIVGMIRNYLDLRGDKEALARAKYPEDPKGMQDFMRWLEGQEAGGSLFSVIDTANLV